VEGRSETARFLSPFHFDLLRSFTRSNCTAGSFSATSQPRFTLPPSLRLVSLVLATFTSARLRPHLSLRSPLRGTRGSRANVLEPSYEAYAAIWRTMPPCCRLPPSSSLLSPMLPPLLLICSFARRSGNRSTSLKTRSQLKALEGSVGRRRNYRHRFSLLFFLSFADDANGPPQPQCLRPLSDFARR